MFASWWLAKLTSLSTDRRDDVCWPDEPTDFPNQYLPDATLYDKNEIDPKTSISQIPVKIHWDKFTGVRNV